LPLLPLDAFPAAIPRGQKILGFDLGEKTIGMALSDASFTIASPLETLKRSKWSKDKAALLTLFEKHQIGAFILGLPVNMDGSEGPRCQATRQFARNLLALSDLPLSFWDERLSTIAVERLMIEADLSRKRRSALVDKAAAAFILQGALDRLR